MAKKRDHKADYARRMARGKARGLSKSQARGHAKPGEKPLNPRRAKSDAGLERAFKLLSQSGTQTAAAKKAKISPERFRRFLKNNNLIKSRKGRKTIVHSGYKNMASYVDGRSVWITLWPFGKQASLNGKYINAVGQFLDSNDPSILESFIGQSIRDANGKIHIFETDPNTLYRLMASVERFEEIYKLVLQ